MQSLNLAVSRFVPPFIAPYPASSGRPRKLSAVPCTIGHLSSPVSENRGALRNGAASLVHSRSRSISQHVKTASLRHTWSLTHLPPKCLAETVGRERASRGRASNRAAELCLHAGEVLAKHAVARDIEWFTRLRLPNSDEAALQI